VRQAHPQEQTRTQRAPAEVANNRQFPRENSTGGVTAGFSVEPGEPKGHRPVRQFWLFWVPLIRGGAAAALTRSSAALPRARCYQAYSLKSRVPMDHGTKQSDHPPKRSVAERYWGYCPAVVPKALTVSIRAAVLPRRSTSALFMRRSKKGAEGRLTFCPRALFVFEDSRCEGYCLAVPRD
jgi:hypothetical protein